MRMKCLMSEADLSVFPTPQYFPNNGLWLGSQIEEITNKLGKPSLQQKQWRHYDSERELVGDPRAKDFGSDKIYERGSISVRAAKGKAVELWATKQTD